SPVDSDTRTAARRYSLFHLGQTVRKASAIAHCRSSFTTRVRELDGKSRAGLAGSGPGHRKYLPTIQGPDGTAARPPGQGNASCVRGSSGPASDIRVS